MATYIDLKPKIGFNGTQETAVETLSPGSEEHTKRVEKERRNY